MTYSFKKNFRDFTKIPKITWITIEFVTFKMTHFAFVNKGQNHFDYTWNLTLIDKCKMCHFECHGLNFILNKFRDNNKSILTMYGCYQKQFSLLCRN
jgi:hypothetical protein